MTISNFQKDQGEGGLRLVQDSQAPNQRPQLAKLGLLAVLGGNLACFLSACIAGLLF